MSWILAIETSALAGGAALGASEPGGDLVERLFGEGRRHCVGLFPAVSDLLAEAGASARDLSGVAVSVGPGSYTGLRIGVAAAKSLAWSLGIPLACVSSLEALAAEALGAEALAERESRARLVPVVDARQGQVYWAEFEPAAAMEAAEGTERVLRRLSCDQVSPAAVLGERARPGTLLFGTGAAACREALGDDIEGLSFADGPVAPAPRRALEIGHRMLAAGEAAGGAGGADVHAVAPVYLRPSAAETQWKERRST